MSLYFESLTESCPQHLRPIWTREIEEAEAERQYDVTSMDYMNPKVEKRNFLQYLNFLDALTGVTALTRREIELKLSETELNNAGQTGQAAWISKGLKIEESQ